MWPDFKKMIFLKLLKKFKKINRNFGGIKCQKYLKELYLTSFCYFFIIYIFKK